MKSKSFFVLIFMLLCGAIIICPTNFVYASPTTTKIQIVADSAKIYESPDTTSTVLKTAYFYEVYDINSISGNFYEIKITTTQNGFIEMAYAMNYANKPLTKILDTNAILTKSSNVYLKNGTEFQVVANITLDVGTRVKLLSGANNQNTYSLITFTQDNANLTYYVLSDNINADGIPVRTLVAIMLIVTCVALFLIIFSFYKKITTKKAI